MAAVVPIPSLYVHVPFCARKCDYCAFYSGTPEGRLVERYVECLVMEMEMVAHDLKPRTIFFGGGTPSLLNIRQWEKILTNMDRLGLSGADEWTVECNPATVSADKARLLRDHGVNRISMGVQSLDEVLLDRLGRIHSREMVFKSYDILRKAGFDNVNLDLMFAIPGQTLDIWNKTLDEILALQSEHLSCYEVIYEEDTALFEQLQAGEIEVDEDLAGEMHEVLLDRAESAGFVQYEVANFARHRGGECPRDQVPDCACRHNVNYWRGGDYYGLGPAAAGHERGIRTRNWSNTEAWCSLVEKGKRPIESVDELSGYAKAGEVAGIGMRMNVGWRFDEFKGVTGRDLGASWQPVMSELVRLGHAEQTDEVFRLTKTGMKYADWAAERFLVDETEAVR